MENNEYAKQQFFTRIIRGTVKLGDPISKDFIALALRDNYDKEFEILKVSTAFIIACWDRIHDIDDYYDKGLFHRALNASKPAELEIVIKEFMNLTGFHEGWNEWPYKQVDELPLYKNEQF